ncbi:MAG: NCS2 family permease [Clostridium sp.]|uniref:NCS2 family permease n=1 Tax=Clostridium sp. TaxID=1506 RepID=UPI003D6CC23D
MEYFKIKENGSDVRKEVIGGITTFLTMAYIIAVNANILGDPAVGMPSGAIVTVTCLTAGLTTIFMGLYANLPFALASGMGLNAFFASVVIVGKVPWQVALTAVFLEGIVFIILSLTNVREAVVNAIPTTLKLAVTAGIGLFIAFIGFVDAGIVVSNKFTKVAMGNFTQPTVLITVIGVIIIVVLSKKKVRGAILWGIAASTLLAWLFAIISPVAATTYGISTPKGIFKFESISPIAFKLNFSYLTDSTKILQFLVIMLTFLFVDFFDTLGTLVGVASKVGMVDKNGNVKNCGRALLVDAVGTTVGAVLGTSTVTTYVESSAGFAEGARTGLASVITGILFLIAMFFSPLFVAIPVCATAPALIVVGFFMMENIVKIDFSDFTEGVPAFLTIALMPLTYSIGDGLTMGILSYAVINFINNIFTKDHSKRKKVSIVIYILAGLFIAKLYFTGRQ